MKDNGGENMDVREEWMEGGEGGRVDRIRRRRRELMKGEGHGVVMDVEGEGHLDYYMELKLREDHERRALWVCPNRRIIMETFSPLYKRAYDFVIAVANPIFRMRFFHYYEVNEGSLYAAVSLGLDAEVIIKYLDRLSKVELPSQVVEFIERCTSRFGKAKLLLRNNRYYVCSGDRILLQQLLLDPEILQTAASPVILDAFEEEVGGVESGNVIGGVNQRGDGWPLDGDDMDEGDVLEVGDGEGPQDFLPMGRGREKKVYFFEIVPSEFEVVKRRCAELDYPLLEEYEYRKDFRTESIGISLKPTTRLREYQEKCLAKLFCNDRIKSGLISLACGAGKSLVGVAVSCALKKKTLVVCTSAVSVRQWIHQFLMWCNINVRDVVGFTSGEQRAIFELADLGDILVTTYSMMANSGNRSDYSRRVLELVEAQEWGILILDEVHVVPANTFRSVISRVKAHCKLGLSATLVREDDLIDHLLYLIGPKLYEANWADLCRAGYIANVRCADVWCPMTVEFYREYLDADFRRGLSLYNLNPNKVRACEYLVHYHEARDDKILVFGDDILALKTYARLLKRPFIYGGTSNNERVRLLSAFQYTNSSKTLFVSKIGDNSIDLPEASVIIQISAHYGSRRQEAQRLGRILRPKKKNALNSASFYSLVSQDTKEVYYSSKRQQFLVEQGYAFDILRDICHAPGITLMNSLEEQMSLLRKVFSADFDSLQRMEAQYEEQEAQTVTQLLPQLLEDQHESSFSYRRIEADSVILSGGSGLEYDEFQEP